MSSISWQDTLNTSVNLGASVYNIRMAIIAAQLSVSGGLVRVQFVAGTNVFQLNGASIAERSGSTGNAVTTPTRLTFGGNNSVTIAANASQWSDWVTFNLDETKDYLVHAFIGSGSYIKYKSSGGYTSYYHLSVGEPDQTLVQNISGYTSDALCYDIDEIDVDTAAPPAGPASRRRIVIAHRRL